MGNIYRDAYWDPTLLVEYFNFPEQGDPDIDSTCYKTVIIGTP